MRSYVAVIAVIAVIVLAGAGAWNLLESTNEPEAITLGTTPYESSLFIFVAEEQGLFARNGLIATIREYPSAPGSVKSMEKNETDMAFASEYAVVSEAFTNQDIRVLGSISQYHSLYLVGKKDAGIENLTDVNGKKIGLRLDSVLEFFLSRFLFLHGLSADDVSLVNVPYSDTNTEYLDAITNGSVDAVVAASMYVVPIKERLGDTVVVWPVQSGQPGYVAITCRDDWLASHPDQARKVLTALDQAEEYVNSHPDESRALLQKKLNYTDGDMARIWPEYQYSLALDQALLTVMEDEGQWMIANNITSATTLPNFRDVVSPQALLDVDPAVVTIR